MGGQRTMFGERITACVRRFCAGNEEQVPNRKKRKALQPTDEEKADQKKAEQAEQAKQKRLKLAEDGVQLSKFNEALIARVARKLKEMIGNDRENFRQLKKIHPRMVAIWFLAVHREQEQIGVFDPVMPIDSPTFMFVDFDKLLHTEHLIRRMEKFYSKYGCKYVDEELCNKALLGNEALLALEAKQDTDGVLTIQYHAPPDSFVHLPNERDCNMFRKNVKEQKVSDARKLALSSDLEFLITAQSGQGRTAQH